MRALWRFTQVLIAAVLLWPEFPRYRAEWQLADASRELEQILSGRVDGADAVQRAGAAQQAAAAAELALPGDARPALMQSLALMLLQRGEAAKLVLERAIASGERPELTVNLGRARAMLGDEPGAQLAFLRSAWAAPNSLASLPKATREVLLAQVALLEGELRAGRMSAPPALRQ